MFLQGSIISGEFDASMNEFSIQKVKDFDTQSVLNRNQVDSLYQYLINHQDEDGQIITLNDQMLVRLSQNEWSLLITDMEKIVSMYH
ncbi:hypothetical protein QTG56_02250 [Rossellomorea sp. AcN35-11]|nr:hypothetical protein [Rossellomorea aquimaris]NMH68190.1 hypothetical protein [Bacillus sp. RO3]WJV30003.1 hypothetical protein QTG56_02250 [Rossellomorea sp. AcN35-11]